MDIPYNIVTSIISIIAVIIAIITYIQNSKAQKRQIRAEKLEEILAITHVLTSNYHYFEDTFVLKTMILKKTVKNKSEIKTYKEQISELRKIAEEIKLRKKLSRLYVLNNSYLPREKLKDKLGVFITVYNSIATHTIVKPFKMLIEAPFNKFPKRWDFLDFTQEIQNEIIEEMELGYKVSGL